MSTKIDPNYIFKDIKGKKIPSQDVQNEPDPEKKKKIKIPYYQLRDCVVNALLFPHKIRDKMGNLIDEQIDGKEKLKRLELAELFQNTNDLIELQSEEISMIKELVARRTPTMISGQAWRILDPIDPKKKH